jgi:hypothetical protein
MRDLLTTRHHDVATGATGQVAHDRRLEVDASLHRPIVISLVLPNRVRLDVPNEPRGVWSQRRVGSIWML